MTDNRKGRKPAKDPKRQVYVYIEQSLIDLMGGMDECREKIVGFCYGFEKKRK